MSKKAVMPLSDYVSACDKIREKIPDIVLVDKTIYREQEGSFTETLVTGTLLEGEQYLIKYTDTGLGNIDEGGIYSASLVNVPNVGSALGMAVILKHPVAENATHTIYVYQSGVDIMLYVENEHSAENGSVSISVIATTGKIVSGELAEKVDEVYEAGKNVERNVFWNGFQQNGTRCDYSRAFGGNGWNADNFKPKYDIVSSRCDHMFNYTTMLNIDLAKTFEDLGIKFDTSGSQFFGEMFSFSAITRVPTIDVSKATSWYNMFTFSDIKKVDKFIINSNGNQTFSDVFYYAENLEDIIFEGVIGQNGLNLQWSKKLSKASWTNIMTKLSPYTTGLSITGSLESVKKAFETSEGANDGNMSNAWLTLCGRRDNWTISLV